MAKVIIKQANLVKQVECIVWSMSHMVLEYSQHLKRIKSFHQSHT